MKILLIRHHEDEDLNPRLPPSINKARGAVPPLGLAYIAGSLIKEGHAVKIIDSLVLRISDEILEKKIKEFKPEIVGITTMTPTFKCSLRAAKTAKHCGAIVVIGGSHLSAYPAETLSYDYIDYGIIGEGEFPFVKLADAIKNKKPVKDIEGLVYRDSNGKVITNLPSIIKNIDSIPMPAHELLPLNKYGTIISEGKIATMVTSRGCPYQCGFCFKQPADRFFRTRNPKLVADEIEYLINEHGVEYIMFYDDTLTVKRDHVVSLCNEILSRGIKIKWESPTRVNHVDLELLKLMKKAGCVRLRFGVESGNEQILKIMNKRITKEQVVSAINGCKKVGIESFAYFIIAYPTETEKTMQDTIDFAVKISPDYVMFNVAVPYPKTNLYDLALKEGIVTGDYWADFTLGKKVKKIPPFIKDANKWVKKAYLRFYLRPRFLFRELLKIRSYSDLVKHINAFIGVLEL